MRRNFTNSEYMYGGINQGLLPSVDVSVFLDRIEPVDLVGIF